MHPAPYWIRRAHRTSKRQGAPILLQVCIAKCIVSLLEFLSKMSVIMCAITGNSFMTSGSTVVNLFTTSFGNANLTTGIW